MVCFSSQWEPMTTQVGTYILFLISEKYNKNDFGLYRDDGLGVVKNKSGQEREKKVIVIQCNMEIVNYLDVSLNLNDSKYNETKRT